MIFTRKLLLPPLLAKKSFFLFGPRSTGKSTLIQTQLPKAKIYDLLDDEVYSRLLRRPKLLMEENEKEKVIVIDEIQKLPKLLDEAHRLIEKQKIHFLLTGSSSRKLKRGLANLLGGRAWQASLFPLTYSEIPNFKLIQYLNRGGLPHIYQSQDYTEELNNYVSLYLREEIASEGLVRKLDNFAHFLDFVALSNGEEINYANIASDAGVPVKTLQNYFQILEDTLIGFQLPAFTKTKKRKAITRSKFYLFDIGVCNKISRRGTILPKSELFGKAFEHFLLLELRAYLSYQRKDLGLYYWRSTSQFEVDCIIGQELACEFKATETVTERHLKGLLALKEEGLVKKYCVVSNDPVERILQGIAILPWEKFLTKLWSGQIFKN